ncbi:MAG: hypothetical protein DI537_38680 [Stutzerimonas stutzeri]|nr:MAG: hypothetical protein DI537_38680 [Stutzerimonas stutzeri]
MQRRAALCSALIGVALAALTPAFAQTASTPAAKMDIAGVRIGMTEAEARAALTAFDPSMRIIRTTTRYNYSPGEGRAEQSTPEFFDRLEVRTANGAVDLFTVYFANPPGEARVVAIERPNLAHTQNPPTQQQFRASLTAKYGQPSFVGEAEIVWEEAGKPRCSFSRAQNRPLGGGLTRERLFPTLSQAQQSRTGILTLPTDIATCGQVLSYVHGTYGPVTIARASLLDMGAIWAADMRTTAWVNGLKAEAKRKADAQAQAPKL